MGGLSPDDIFTIMEETIPHENTYFLEGLPQSWLVREDYLLYFGAFTGDDYQEVEVVIRRDEKMLPPMAMPMVSPSTELLTGNEPPVEFVSYKVYNDLSATTAVFQLDACIFDDTFKKVMTEFWSNVYENAVDIVVLDLRNNRGGDATVIPAFLNNLNASDDLSFFSVKQRQSAAFCEGTPMFCDNSFLSQFGIDGSDEVYSVTEEVISLLLNTAAGEAPNKTYSGDFFVLTSGTTFSSASLFAMMVQDNQVGTVVGTPTGSALNFYGNVLNFSIPHTDLKLFLTTSLTTGATTADLDPNVNDAVYPDVEIKTSLDDIKLGVDSQLDWVLNSRTSDSTSVSSTAREMSAFSVKNIALVVGMVAITTAKLAF